MAQAQGAAEGRGPALRRLLVLTGIELEARGIARVLSRRGHGGTPSEVVAVGMGGRHVEAVLHGRALDDTLIVSAGLCGALDPAITASMLVVPDAVRLPSGALLPIESTLAITRGWQAARGVLLAVDRVVTTPAEKRALWQRTGAVAVDMESGAVLAAAAARGVPALVIRAVADTAADTVAPELSSILDGQGRVRVDRAVRTMLRRPDLMSQAVRMALTSRRGLRSVARALIALQRSLTEVRQWNPALLRGSS